MRGRLLFLFFFSLSIVALAFETFALEVLGNIPSPTGRKLTDTSSINELVAYFYEWGIALGGLATFVALLIAGFQYLTSVGDPVKMKDAKDRIVSAFLGLILLLSSWLILNTINPHLTALTPPGFTPPSTSTFTTTTFEIQIPKCKSVTFYSSTTYTGNKKEYEIGEKSKMIQTLRQFPPLPDFLDFTPYSLQITEPLGCQVIFFKDPMCESEKNVSLTATEDVPDLSQLIGEEKLKEIKCIMIKPFLEERFFNRNPFNFNRPQIY